MATYILVWSSFDPSIKYGSLKQFRKDQQQKRNNPVK